MTTPENAEMRQLALKVLRQHAGPAAGGEAIAAAAQRAFDDLARVSVPLIGQVGVEALAGRAVHLAQREHQWLVCTRAPEQPEELFAQVASCIERQDPAVATEGAGAVFAALTRLLVTFIGEPLTARLLRQAWPYAFSDVSTEEI
ncbi:MAG: hypothetical protein H0U19_12420 [Acidobacteria bacterium]|nr:hypothetical protein [Acidobacteriota bacterium]